MYDQTKRKQVPELAEAARIRSSPRWQAVRTLHKAQNPLCCDPFREHTTGPVPTAQSHHIKPLATHPHLAFDMSNLAPLCDACHARVERIERGGDSTEGLFAA